MFILGQPWKWFIRYGKLLTNFWPTSTGWVRNYFSLQSALGIISYFLWPFIDDETRAVAKEKADAMNERIGYPEILTNRSELEKEYVNVSTSWFFSRHKLNNNISTSSNLAHNRGQSIHEQHLPHLKMGRTKKSQLAEKACWQRYTQEDGEEIGRALWTKPWIHSIGVSWVLGLTWD